MKNLSILLLFTALVFTNSCKKEDFTEPRERNSAKFLGVYYGNMVCGTTPSTNVFTIEDYEWDENKVFLLFDLYVLEATISGNTFAFGRQSINDPQQGTLYLQGYGSISGNSLSMVFTAEIAATGASGTCTFNGSK